MTLLTDSSMAWDPLLGLLAILLLALVAAMLRMEREYAATLSWYSNEMSKDSAKRAGMNTTSSPTSGGGVEYDAEADLVEALDILYRCHEYLDRHDLNPDMRREIAEFVGLDEK